MKRTVWEQGSMSSTLETVPPPELIEYIETIYLGTPGGLQYHHTTGIEKLKRVDNCYFLFLRRAGNMLGSIGYVLREAHTGDKTHTTWLIRYFTMKAPMRTEKKGSVKKRPLENRGFSMLKDITHIFHNNPERLRDFDTTEIPQALIYGLVEKNNERSRNFAEIGGYQKIGDVESFIFSRLRTRRKTAAEQLSEKEQPHMRSLLREFYRNHSLYFDDYIFHNNDYYVLREGDEIVAGLQANNESWEIKTIGNTLLDKVIRVVTKIPFVKKRFRYEEMRFLGIEGFYYKEGHEKELYRLLEGVLALKKQYLALLILDVRSPIYRLFHLNKRIGPVHTFLGSFKAEMHAKFFNFPEEEQKEVMEKPAYISIYDNT